jgi:dihydrofolate reductase
MGKNMFVEGEANWPEESPFHCPVYVLTNQQRKPLERPGGTIFYFTNEDIKTVLLKAKKDAGKKDVRISGGADVISQYFNAGLIDEFNLHVAPIMIRIGIRLFEKFDKEKLSVEILDTINSPLVSHLFYKVNK